MHGLPRPRGPGAKTLVALAVLLGLMAAACGGGAETEATVAGGEPSGAAGAADTVGIVAPTTDGGQFDFNDLQGKPALLWFWAPW